MPTDFMRVPFPFVPIEGHPYPTVVVGGDRFTGIFGPPRNRHLEQLITAPEYISNIFEACYHQGFRGYDISISDPVIGCFRQLKEKYPDTVGIGNPNWNCGLMLGTEPLREQQARITAHLLDRVFSEEEIVKQAALPELERERWFACPPHTIPLNAGEIASIWLDVDRYQAEIDKIKSCCDFCLVGTVFADWLPLVGRIDLIEAMVAMVRQNGLIPLSIHHWTSLVLPLLDELDVAGHWTYLNKACQILTEADAIEAIRQSEKPVTAFKALLSREPEDVAVYLEYLFDEVGVAAVDFGVETAEEAQCMGDILHDRICIANLKVPKSG